MNSLENRKSQDKPLGFRFKACILVLAIIAVLLSGLYHQPTQPQYRISVTPLVVGTVNLTVTTCGDSTCGPWENYYNCPQDCPEPWVLFVSPTPRNEVTNNNWVYVNVTLNKTANTAYLEWNGVNETIDGSGLNFHKNKTGLLNANHTFLVWANMTTGWNSSETRWVRVDYTPPAPEEEPPTRRAPITMGPSLPITVNRTVEVAVEAVLEEERETISLLNVTVSLSSATVYEPKIETRTTECGLQEDIIYVFELPFQCLDINTNIKPEDLNNATIEFRVSRSWIGENNINISTIKLVRRPGSNIRQELLTWQTDADNEFIYFEALTYGFSVFMILGEPITPSREIVPLPYCGDGICDLSIGEGCETCLEDCRCPLGESCVRNTCIPDFYLWSMHLYMFSSWFFEKTGILTTSLVMEVEGLMARLERATYSYFWLPILLYTISIIVILLVLTLLYRRSKKSERIKKIMKKARKRKIKKKRKGEYGSQIFPED